MIRIIFRSLRLNEIDTALVGGTESCIGRLGFFGFSAMHALSSHSNDSPTEGSCPFDLRRNGFVMGEGSVVMVLEPYEKAIARGATIYISFSELLICDLIWRARLLMVIVIVMVIILLHLFLMVMEQ